MVDVLFIGVEMGCFIIWDSRSMESGLLNTLGATLFSEVRVQPTRRRCPYIEPVGFVRQKDFTLRTLST
jgi:hypothetical protein